jgi:hypothetical protein
VRGWMGHATAARSEESGGKKGGGTRPWRPECGSTRARISRAVRGFSFWRVLTHLTPTSPTLPSSRLQIPCMPIDLPYSLDPISLPLRVHHLHVFPPFPSRRCHLLPFLRPSRAPLVSGVLPYMYTRAAGDFGGGATLDFLFRPLSLRLRPTVFPPVSAHCTLSINAGASFLDTKSSWNTPRERVLHTHRYDGWSSALCMAGESRPTKRSRVDAYSKQRACGAFAASASEYICWLRLTFV